MRAPDAPAEAVRPDHEAAPDVVRFWQEAGPDRWFAKDPAFDAAFRERFIDLHFAAARRELDAWLDTPESALALLLLLDQFPRNAFRGTGHMYATDPLARWAAAEVLERGHDQRLDPSLRLFCYLPFSHSESLVDQERSLSCNRRLGEPFISHALAHREIILRFGRFPHRNAMLGRSTTARERLFLEQGGFAG